jgi:hypothetical protein
MGILKKTVERISDWIHPGAEPAKRDYYRFAPSEADSIHSSSNLRFSPRNDDMDDEHLGYWTPNNSD